MNVGVLIIRILIMTDSRRRRALRHNRCPNCRQRGHFASECTASFATLPSTSATYTSGSSAFVSQTSSSFSTTFTSMSSISVPPSLVLADEFNKLPASLDLPNETSTVSKEQPSQNLYDKDDEPVWDGKSFHYAGQSYHWDPILVDTVYENPSAKVVEPSESPIARSGSTVYFH